MTIRDNVNDGEFDLGDGEVVLAERDSLYALEITFSEKGRYCADCFKRVDDGVKHLFRYYDELDVAQIKNDLDACDRFSSRPYKLAQGCDGSIDDVVHALFYDYCKAEGIDPYALRSEAYPNEKRNFDFKVIKSLAEWQGVEYPNEWGADEFSGLLVSLNQINNYSMANVLARRHGERYGVEPPDKVVRDALREIKKILPETNEGEILRLMGLSSPTRPGREQSY